MSEFDPTTFRRALGDDAVVVHPPVAIDGAMLGVTLRPADGEALGVALERLASERRAVIIRGGGTRLGIGNPPRPVDAFLSTERLDGIDEFDPDDGVVHVKAGTPFARLWAETSAAGWEPTLEAVDEVATVGGAIATAAVGPRSLGWGPLRDAVLGLEVRLASGVRTRCGGRVVKNVTGYDLAKLYTGSYGSLGVIEGAWLRLRPSPERRCVVVAASGGESWSRALAASRCGTAVVAALVAAGCAGRIDPALPAGDEGLLVVELAGDEAAVEADRAGLLEVGDFRPGESDLLHRIRALQAGVVPGSGIRFRIAALPSRLRDVASALEGRSAAWLAYPGLGLLYGGFELENGADFVAVDTVLRVLRNAVRDVKGSCVIESAPPQAKVGTDVFGETSDALPISRALKQRFDPDGVLNPGRFIGGI